MNLSEKSQIRGFEDSQTFYKYRFAYIYELNEGSEEYSTVRI